MTDDDQDDARQPPSKTQRKREMQALQALGERLVTMKSRELATIPLPEELDEAVQSARRTRSREGRRRQLQYIGKLMRSIDTGPISTAIQELDSGRKRRTQRFQHLETLRDRLIADDAAQDEVMRDYPDAERQRLRQYIRGARQEQAQEKPPAQARRLFRYLRELDGLDD